MSENYIVINGKKAELTEEQLKALGLEIKSPFARTDKGNIYYAISITGEVELITEKRIVWDKERHDVANYCTDEKMMQQQAYRETLNRLLWRYSMEHKGNEINWSDDTQAKWSVCFDHKHNSWEYLEIYRLDRYGSVYFLTREIAESATKEIIKPFMAQHPDFKF